MHPFHRKHTSGGVSQGPKVQALGRSKNGDRDENGEYRDPRDEYDETLEEAMEYNRTHPRRYPPILSKNALKDKENVLLESLKAFKTRTSYDNKTRLGPNKENTFQNLKRSRSTSSMEQATLLPSSNSQTPVSEPFCDNILRAKCKSISISQSSNEQHEDDPRNTGENNDEQLTLNNNLENNKLVDEECVEIPETEGLCEDTNKLVNTDEINLINSGKYSNNIDNLNCSIITDDLQSTSDALAMSLQVSSISDSNNTTDISEGSVLKQPYHKTSNAIDQDEGLEDCECDESDGGEEVSFIPLKLASAIALKKLIIGSAIRSFNLQWMGQSFVLSNNPKFRYGFVQNKGGACGVLASVQAYLLKALLFNPETATSETDPLRPTRQEVRKALVQALTEILWRAGDCKQAALARSNQESHLEENLVYRPDGLTDSLEWKRFYKEKDLLDAIEKHLDEFVYPHSKGCLRLIISVILSSGIQRVLGDMDDETSPLIGPTGTCSLELVNLLLTGRAVSNVFDNNVQLDSCLLQGVSKRSEIGFLSIYEHFNTCQVGSNLKTPRYPIWLVNSENHFSVVFSACKQLVSDWRAERQFHLYHYDGLVTQAEETIISIDTTGFSASDNSKRENIPPLELCIKTKWKDAIVHWNSGSS